MCIYIYTIFADVAHGIKKSVDRGWGKDKGKYDQPDFVPAIQQLSRASEIAYLVGISSLAISFVNV